MVIGPVIADGFYYDIYSKRPFTPEDLAAIEQRMVELIAQDYDAVKHTTARPRCRALAQRAWRGKRQGQLI